MSQTIVPVSENTCPDCLYMSIEGRPRIRASSPEPNQVVLFLTINFNEQIEKLPGGHVKFGLRGGELRLELTQGAIPYSSRKLQKTLATGIPKTRTIQTATMSGKGSTIGVDAVLSPTPEIKPKLGFNDKRERSDTQSDTFTIESCQITTKGDLSKPAWVFEVQTHESILKGSLCGTELATMNLSGNQWRVKASFVVPTLQDVKITQAEGPWLRNVVPAKRTAIELGLAKLLLKRKLMPCISQMEISHG